MNRGSFAALACALAAAPLAAADFAAQPVPREYFGLHIHRIGKGTPWPDIPFGSWRLWDAYVAWPNLNPAPGRFDFAALDAYVDQAQAKDVQVLLPLGLSPAWASSRPDEPSAYAVGNAAPPAHGADWVQYVATVAQRYRGRVAAYEIWNEPNRKKFFSGEVADAVALACAAYQTIKTVDPSATVVSPAATDQKAGVAWVADFLKAGGGRCVDAIGFHFYTLAHEPPEALVALYRELRAAIDRAGFSKLPVWNTESGWYVENARVRVDKPYRVLKADEAPAYVVRAFLLGAWLGLDRFFWYAWDNRDLGLMEPDTKEPKPMAAGYRAAMKWVGGSRIAGCSQPTAGAWVCEMRTASGRAWIAWAERGETSWTPPADWRIARQEAIDGSVIAVRAGQPLRLGGAPVRLS